VLSGWANHRPSNKRIFEEARSAGRIRISSVLGIGDKLRGWFRSRIRVGTTEGSSENVVIRPPVATARATASVSIAVASNLWITWAAIAIEEASAARQARTAIVQAYTPGDPVDTAPETKAALKAIGAASFALDALGNVLQASGVPKPSKAQAAAHCPPAEKRNRGDWVSAWIEAAFDDAPKLQLTRELHDLFELRHGGVHHRVVMKPPTTHPLGFQTTEETVTYTTEEADQHVHILFRIFAMMVDSTSPHPQLQEAFISHRPALQRWLHDADDFRTLP
jgi:hypothetical protein